MFKICGSENCSSVCVWWIVGLQKMKSEENVTYTEMEEEIHIVSQLFLGSVEGQKTREQHILLQLVQVMHIEEQLTRHIALSGR